MALRTRKTPTTRGQRAGTGSTAKGQGKTNMIGRGRKAGAGNTALGSNAITPQMIENYQQWLRFGQKYNLINRLFASPQFPELHNTYQQNQQNQQNQQPAKLTAGTRRTAQERQAANT